MTEPDGIFRLENYIERHLSFNEERRRSESWPNLHRLYNAALRIDGSTIVTVAFNDSTNIMQIIVERELANGERQHMGGFDWDARQGGSLISPIGRNGQLQSERLSSDNLQNVGLVREVGEKLNQYIDSGLKLDAREARELANFVRSGGRDLPD